MMVDALAGFLGLPSRIAGTGVIRADRASSAATTAASPAASEAPLPTAALAGAGVVGRARPMYVIVVGGGKVGYYLTKELLAAGPRARADGEGSRAARARSRTRSAASCSTATAARASTSRRPAPSARPSWRPSPVTTRTTWSSARWPSTTSTCRETIARVNNPRNEALFRHLGVDEIISPTRMALAAIEQDIPVHELLHLAQLQGGELELLEAQIGAESPGDRAEAGGHRPARRLLAVRADPRRAAP